MEHFASKTFSDALILVGKWKGKAQFIAGGTNVVPDMRAKVLKPNVLIDISRLNSLLYIKEEKSRVRIGALTPISEIASSEVIKKYAPILSEAADQLGNLLVRNRATIAGNLADASPAADTAVHQLVLEATVLTDRNGGKGRKIQIDQFFTGPNQIVLKKDEMIKEVFFPKPNPNTKMAYIKLNRIGTDPNFFLFLLTVKGCF